MADDIKTNTPQTIPQKKKYTVKVIRDKCIGAASCVGISPLTFRLDEENKAVVISEIEDAPENILLAAQSCPTAAIIIADEGGTQIWPK